MAGKSDIIQQVSVRAADDIRPAAEALKAVFNDRLPGWMVAPTANIASKAPMVDEEGEVLTLDVFGFAEEEEKFWEESRIAAPLAPAPGLPL